MASVTKKFKPAGKESLLPTGRTVDPRQRSLRSLVVKKGTETEVNNNEPSKVKRVVFEDKMSMEAKVKKMWDEAKENKEKMKKLELEKEKDSKKLKELVERCKCYEEWMDDMTERMEALWDWYQEVEGNGEARSLWSEATGGSRYSLSSGSSRVSRLSMSETKRLKSMAKKSEFEERRDNIVVKGTGKLEREGQQLDGAMEEFLFEKLGIEVKVEKVWTSGRIYIAKMGSQKDKEEVMKNKGKLKETKIFIDHDLSFEERKRQSDIQEWAKVQREKGETIRIGYGKVKVGDGDWQWWDRILEEEAKKERERRQAEWDRQQRERNNENRNAEGHRWDRWNRREKEGQDGFRGNTREDFV